MAEYRFYCLDGAGRISFAEEIDAANDEEAIAKARELKPDAVKCEIWDDHRLVATLDLRDVAN
ncbi:MAG TPA: hypothetical protein VJ597_08305 [Sphingomicrobium sp.]|nr:hypothetical protein [Sphingomicrobium sp.]